MTLGPLVQIICYLLIPGDHCGAAAAAAADDDDELSCLMPERARSEESV